MHAEHLTTPTEKRFIALKRFLFKFIGKFSVAMNYIALSFKDIKSASVQ